ncbi:MAG: T9SS type A sorting domain-containing protein [Prolixibacteraceae bacterium]
MSQKTCLYNPDFEAFGEKAKNHVPFSNFNPEKLQNPTHYLRFYSMYPVQFIRKFLIVTSLAMVAHFAQAQFITQLVDYSPAPGQYTNADFVGTPSAAASVVGKANGLVSLGDFGGSVTVYFSSGIQNDPANPYGVDFTVFGNATQTWSEPGIIQVMKDENKNGLPDDTWYEIAGSDYFWNTTTKNYEITYQNNGLSKSGNIFWTDNQGQTGFIPESSFHQQPYYPRADLFPHLPADQLTLSGTRLAGQIDLSNPGVVQSYRRAFGYADNTPVLSISEKKPDNPYTTAVEGSGGDAVDISWAVDQAGNHVTLDEIHFIRISTGMNALAGWLGEISTEIAGIRDVETASIDGIRTLLVIQDLPRKIFMGQALQVRAQVFESGILQENTTLNWSINNPELATLESGMLKVLKPGTFTLKAVVANNPLIYSEKEFEVFSAGKAEITLVQKTLKVTDKLELTGKLTDQSGAVLAGISPVWRIGDKTIAEIVSVDGKSYLLGKSSGKSWLYLEAAEVNSIRDSVLIEVFPESARKKVFVAVKTEENTIIPRHSVWVDQLDLTAKVDRHQKNYGLEDIPFVSLAHAVAAVLNDSELKDAWAFRDDAEGGSKLYLWKVPEIQDGSVLNVFGYGGSRSSESYRRTWVVMLNQEPYVSGFDRIKVNNGDEILIYHIADNSLPWEVTHLISGSDSVKINQVAEIQIKKYTCSMDDSRIVAVNSSDVLVNNLVQVEIGGESSFLNNLITDEFGKAVFTARVAADYIISSGIDASVLVAESVTGIKSVQENQLFCSVFPNPFTETIQLICVGSMESVQIFDVFGKSVFYLNNPLNKIELTNLLSGIYVIMIQSGKQVFLQKIIKK